MQIARTGNPRKDSLHDDLPAIDTPTLTFLADRAARIRDLGKQAVDNIGEIGRLLLECKERCGHGNWLPWLEQEFGWAERTAQRYISIHELAGKYDNLSDLEVPVSSLYLLAAPSTPESARTEVIERAESGEQLKHAEVREIIASHSPPAEEEEAEHDDQISSAAEQGTDIFYWRGGARHELSPQGLQRRQAKEQAEAKKRAQSRRECEARKTNKKLLLFRQFGAENTQAFAEALLDFPHWELPALLEHIVGLDVEQSDDEEAEE